jgi:hypothetical protein
MRANQRCRSHADPREKPVTENEPGIRRLCVALCAGKAGLLAAACRTGGWGRLLVQDDPGSSAEIGVAQPGIDELALLGGLISGLVREILAGAGPPARAFLAVDVGIVRLTRNGFGGAVLSRAAELAANSFIAAAAGRRDCPDVAGHGLIVVIPDGLFADLRAEGEPCAGWQRVAPAAAWFRSFQRDPQGKGC